MSTYKQLCTEFYDLDKPKEPPEAFAFYRRYAERARGPILEPMCGSGRFLLPLLEQGFDIDGTDSSPFMLEACRTRAQERGLAPRVFQQLLHETELPRRYELVFIPSGSFGLVTDPIQARESLHRLHAHMLPGAKLVFEVERSSSSESCSWPWGGRWIKRPDGALLVISWLGHYDAKTRTKHDLHRYELIEDGQVTRSEVEEFDLRLYEPEELRSLLDEAGFTEVKLLHPFDGAPATESDLELVVEATRP